MQTQRRILPVAFLIVTILTPRALRAEDASAGDGVVVKAVLDVEQAGENLLKPDAWQPWGTGFEREGDTFLCDNGADGKAQRGVGQTVVLNQTRPEPIVAVAESRAEGVAGSPDSDYSLYLDLTFDDGTHLWGQTASFATGTHDWQRRQVVVLPERPVRSLSFWMLLRDHAGKVWFRNPRLSLVTTPEGATRFDGVTVVAQPSPPEGFQVRDVAAGSGFVRIEHEALGLRLDSKKSEPKDTPGVTMIDAVLSDTSGKDRAVTLVYAVAVPPTGLRWLDDPRRTTAVEPGGEYIHASSYAAVGAGRLSRYPLAAVADAERGVGLGIDMTRPAFYRLAYNAATGELFVAYDVGLTPEKPTARVRFCRFDFDPAWAFRTALDRYYQVFPEQFRCRTPEQGLWMPFAKISEVEGWEDFGFKFKEGDNETRWDDEHGILTFRYTEPMTWWMTMPKDVPRTLDAALAEARRLAEKGVPEAKALFTSGYHDRDGRIPAKLLDTPWCNGAVWSMNSMPGIPGDVTDFNTKWNDAIRQRLYGPGRSADLDGEYIDSSEGYVTDDLDFRRDHFAAADSPLTFSADGHQPAILRGLVAMEYVRAIAKDIHGMDKLMMANSTPSRLCWLAAWLDVMGTETNWHYGGAWRPMSDAELLFRRAMCKGKPYCFLMNTAFESFSHELVEKYMRRSLAYGMFPGFFSHNASQGHYFTRPELYNRDRPLFKKYLPLSKLVAETGWEPITRARCDDEHVHLERFGTRYLTVFNDSPQRRTATIDLEGPAPATSRELVTGRTLTWTGGQTTVALDGEDVAVIELR